jgi:cytidine deaminase
VAELQPNDTVHSDGHDHLRLMSPCGRCREIISDLNPDAWVIVRSLDQPYKMRVAELLPLK